MKSYKQINTLLGWVVTLIASAVYILTSEPTMSFWDCGEYIATAFKLEVGHPPGAPLFQMLGRFFSLFAFGDTALVARMINTMSALSSGLTIGFLFWTITMIAKKIALRNKEEMNTSRMIGIMGAGLVGALAYTFTDSFWFSAVEGEVYAMSSFFTAIVFWAIFKWDEQADEKHAYRWLLLIAYLVGLSIGVHMLNLLAIPAITLVYYFRKFPDRGWKGILVALGAGLLLLVIVMYMIIPWVVKFDAMTELFFVNSLGLPFNTGTIVYFVLLIGLIVWGVIHSHRRMKPVLNTILLAFTFILIGYTSFLMLVIRSNANTPIDENNPENAMYLLAYLNREQYGDWPLFSGPYYNAPVIDRKDGTPVYTKDSASGKYLITDKREKVIPVYDPRFTTIFPRMWSGLERKHMEDYKRWGHVKGVPVEIQGDEKPETVYKPTFSENLTYFWRYQVVHMYYRYFMWNFAGRQNDTQGMGGKVDGNWKSGIPFLDEARLGSQKTPAIRTSASDNSFYLLPLILGLIGIWFTVRKDYRNALVIFLLFLMTGLAIVIYLNQYSPQPRERDYAFAGSFYAFAIWIGLGVIQLAEWLGKVLKGYLAPVITTLAAFFLVPVIMAEQGWDDHDRSGRRTALAIAENYLNSCAPNAILFTNGDNDTFPLWYAQEVEGIRTDVRVCNLSLLNTDWYIDQMKRKAYDGEPVPFSLTREKYRQGNHDVTYFIENDQVKDQYIDLRDLFHILNNNESKLKLNTGQYGTVDFFPTRKFMVTYDSVDVAHHHYVPARFLHRMDTLRWTVDRQAVEKNHLMVLDLLAHNDWKRPVYFAMTMGTDVYIGLENYFFLEGMAYRLLPVKARASEGEVGEENTEVLYDNVMNKFKWGNIQDPKVYLDDQNQRMIMNFTNLFGRLASALIREGKTEKAHDVLNKALELFPRERTPYTYFTLPLVEGYYRIGDTAKANELSEYIFGLMKQDLDYLFSFEGQDLKDNDSNIQEDLMTLQRLGTIVNDAKQEAIAKKIDPVFKNYYERFVQQVYEPPAE